ncbi:MAG: YcxB family protein [Lachnospiraceae bacterium]|nr:YcxB family protein [Lachnospiraceae bacterium]MBO4762947.1 YcxB family protein [Lachnospiraceae bacterium]MBQ6090716.1 YcxB family protein [Lachnospiraceae bacterium]MBR5368142.1 YcxB family protein [Lachnospiraceae bacterium]
MNEQEETKKSFSISELAHMNTLSEEETEEAAEQAESIEESGEEAVSYAAVPEEEKPPVELEHQGQTFTADVKPTARDTYGFMFYHTYMNLMGLFAVLVGIAAIVMVVISVRDKEIFQIVLFSIAALIFIVNSPISLYLRARKYAESCKLPENRTIYRFSDAGFDVRRGEEIYKSFPYKNITKCHEGRTGFYIYLAKNTAFLITKADIEGGSLTEFRSLLAQRVTGKLSLKYDKEKEA